MAATKISDVIVPEVFNPYVAERTAALSAFFNSGVVQTIEGLTTAGVTGGSEIKLPFFQDLTGAEEILSDSASLSVNALSTAQDVAVLHARGKAWGANDLAKALSGSDPMAAVADLVAGYWARRLQATLVSTLGGALGASNMTANVHDISEEEGSAAVISGSTFIDAAQSLGDNAEKLVAVAMHSATNAALAKADLIAYERDSTGAATVQTFMGKRVIVDDSLPVETGVYTSYLFGEGAVGYGDAGAPVPTETDRDALAGEDILITRRHFILHPLGVSWTPGEGVPSATTPSNTELADGDNWSRVWEAKNVRIVQFVHKLS